MYVSANLPSLYGQFNEMKESNYPFRTAFTKYLRALSKAGLMLGADMDAVTGWVEDRVFKGRRVPDIPKGIGPVKFRFQADDAIVEEYFSGMEMSNKEAVLHAVRMALRLSVEYGTSLARLTQMVEGLLQEDVDNLVETVDNFTDEDDGEKMGSVQKGMDVPVPAYVPKDKESGIRIVKKDGALPKEQQDVPKKLEERLKELVKAGDELIAGTEGQEDVPAGGTVVETNPLLGDFLNIG